MRSSTSSFDIIPAHTLRAWLIGVIAACAVFLAMELLWRSRGVAPSVPNSSERWGFELDRLKAQPTGGVALLGSSRFQTGVDPALLGQRLGQPVFNLSFNNTNPLPILTYLVERTDFSGTVLIEAMPTRLFGEDKASIEAAQGLIVSYQGQTISDGLNDRVGVPVYGHLATLHPSLRLREILGSMVANRRPPYANKAMRPDRLLEIDFSVIPASELAQVERRVRGELEEQRPLAPDAVAARMERIRELVTAIRARGGRVIFFRPVSTGIWLDLEEQRYPSEQWSARLLAPIATCSLDFRESPALAAMRAPDFGHIDRTDVAPMTEALADLIQRRCPAP